jgi:hypothetical protein
MRMPPLTTGDVENASTGRQGEQFQEATYLAPIARQVEDRLVLEQIVGVEVRLPPLGRLLRRRQKKTGSR